MKGKLFAWMLVICWMLVIFTFSQMTGSSSGKSSGSILSKIVSIFVEDEKIDEVTEKLHYPFRKMCHFAEFFILAILVYNLLMCYELTSKHLILYTLLWCFLYACSDEIHQIFVDGRGPAFMDVLFDTFGSITYLGINALFLHKKKR